MNREDQKQLDIISNPDVGDGEKIKALQYFLERIENVANPGDITPVIRELYFDSHQVPVMEPCADILNICFLKQHNSEGFKHFIASDTYKSFILESIERLTVKNYDISLFLPIIISYLPDEEYIVYRIIEAFVYQHPGQVNERWAMVLDVIGNSSKKIQPYAAFIVQEGAGNSVDVSPLLPALMPFIKVKAEILHCDAVYALRLAVESGNDISSVESQLIGTLGASGDLDKKISYILGYFFIQKHKWSQLDTYVHSENKHIVYGMYHALSVQYNNQNKNNPRVFSYLITGITGSFKKVRQLVRSVLENHAKNNIHIFPDEETVNKLVSSLNSRAHNEELFHYLYYISEQDVSIAHTILDYYKEEKVGLTGMGKKLHQSISDLLSGTFVPVCSICSHIDRYKTYSDSCDLPEQAQKLSLYPLETGTNYSYSFCPECKTPYYYSFDQEYEDMSLDTTIVLKRLDPGSALELLKEVKKEHYQEDLENIIHKYHQDLTHTVEFAREEAAWALTGYFIHKGKWQDIKKLLEATDTVVVKTCLQVIASTEPKRIDYPVINPVVKSVLLHKELGPAAAEILTKYAIKIHDYSLLNELLTIDSGPILQSITYQIWMGVRHAQLKVKPLFSRLTVLTVSGKRETRKHCRYALDEALDVKERDVLEILIQNLQSDSMKLQKEAAFSINLMAGKKKDVSKAVPYLIRLFQNSKTRFEGISCLKKIVNMTPADVGVILPALMDLYKDKNHNYHNDITQILYNLAEKGVDIKQWYELFAEKLITKNQDDIYMEIELLNNALENNHDLSSCVTYFEHYLEKYKNKLNDSNGDAVITALTAYYYTHKEWSKLKGLLNHSKRAVPGMAAYWLDAQKITFLEPILTDLVKNIIHSYSFVREYTLEVLTRYAQVNSENSALLKKELDTLQVGTKKKLKEYKKLKKIV